ncbi:MAG: hypothetical protein COU46_00455 [Candidatus Niyogibacteria bacterium CG10_big_fil_rev_8_21_14_0_10_42_19]|uniref:Phosphatidic acid phosphatase type 2/haloperoxidase domain-containing protein n=1 Tax=Candidatus Niyogibacteria bacterium CG10_big_fil_rev_8_21_14_0_10_42_19 TaxID=1974725 RepID=A0A2H0TGF7_9BACT|nr:MAG: hypothetical protein COU46_00455 [Candidatus Niyogibacteria bacterium CG10_big_fil_rev_8_21_14_0_10_42_19]
MNAFDLYLFRPLNSLAGSSGLFDSMVVFFAVYLLAVMLAGLAVFLLITFFPRYRHLRKENAELFIFALASAFVSRFVVAQFIRFLYDRPRPFEVLESARQIVEHSMGHAFPSGHASFTFGLAIAVYFYRPKIGVIFIAAAFLVSISRVVAGIHWPLDIISGALVGVLTAFILRALKRKYY